ncbi:MAG: CYTH domain-containing protein [Algisphaera sp.]
MAFEIERKFLVVGDDWRAADAVFYCQGYLNRDKQRTVRVRIAGEAAFLTVKGLSVGACRSEFEYPLPLDDAQALLKLCEPPLIEKHRRVIEHAGFQWEVDSFLGLNAGLVVAEIELDAEDQVFEKPDWVGEEVTGDARYFNSSLSAKPFTTW